MNSTNGHFFTKQNTQNSNMKTLNTNNTITSTITKENNTTTINNVKNPNFKIFINANGNVNTNSSEKFPLTSKSKNEL